MGSEKARSGRPERGEHGVDVPAWLAWARRIQALAQEGLAYTEGPFDRVRYEELRGIAAEILAAHGRGELDRVETDLQLETGYPTPKVDVRGVVMRGAKMLFVREVADGLWSLPGGWADAGATPSEAIVREIEQETGYATRATRLLALYDRDRQGHPPFQWPVYKLFVQCELIGGHRRESMETDGVAFFGLEDLPPLSTNRVLERQIRRMFELAASPGLAADFD